MPRFFRNYQLLLLSLSLDRSALTGEHAGHLARAVADGYIDSMWMIDSTASLMLKPDCAVQGNGTRHGRNDGGFLDAGESRIFH